MRKSDQIERRMKLHDLRVFMNVAQAGSMLKAAQRLNTSQPAISRSIAVLEHALGVRLLDRSRRGAEPTIYGQALLDCGTAVFDDLRQGVKNVEFLLSPTEGELRIAGDGVSVAGLIPVAIGRLQRKFPRIDVHVAMVNELSQQRRVLRERTHELVVARLAQPIEKDLAAESLFQEGIVVVAGAHNTWSRRRNIKLADLAGERWLLPTLDSVMGSSGVDIFRESGLEFPPKGAVTGAALYMCNALVAHGDFLSFFPSSLLRYGAKHLGLKVLPVSLPVPSSPFGILRLKARTVSPLAHLFIASVHEVVRTGAEAKAVHSGAKAHVR
jgi:DNA-binding transcriptional LysR family regulator